MDLNGVSTDDFAIETLSELKGKFAFPGAGGTRNHNHLPLVGISLLIRSGLDRAGRDSEKSPAQCKARRLQLQATRTGKKNATANHH